MRCIAESPQIKLYLAGTTLFRVSLDSSPTQYNQRRSEAVLYKMTTAGWVEVWVTRAVDGSSTSGALESEWKKLEKELLEIAIQIVDGE